MSVISEFEGFLEAAGKDFAKGLGFAVNEAPAAGALLNLLYPGLSTTVVPLVSSALSLLQNSIISIEQKYASSGVQHGTGTQKTAEVLALAGPAVTQLLTTAGVSSVTDSYISSLTTAIVGVLNAVQPVKVA